MAMNNAVDKKYQFVEFDTAAAKHDGLSSGKKDESRDRRNIEKTHIFLLDTETDMKNSVVDEDYQAIS